MKLYDEGKLRLQTEMNWLEELWNELGDYQNTVPQPLHFNDQQCVLVMSDAKGATAQDVITSSSGLKQMDEPLRRAGSWLAAFHSRSIRKRAFDPNPHSRWLLRSIEENNSGARRIIEHSEFSRIYETFTEYDELACQTITDYCVTHRDFNTGNLILRGNGQAFGIDFYNRREDVWVRDVLRFLEDGYIRFSQMDKGTICFDDLWNSFIAGYGLLRNDRAASRYFCLFYALNSWANVGLRRRPTKYDLGRLKFAKHLAQRIVAN